MKFDNEIYSMINGQLIYIYTMVIQLDLIIFDIVWLIDVNSMINKSVGKYHLQ